MTIDPRALEDADERDRLEGFLKRLTGDRWHVRRQLGTHAWEAVGRCILPASANPRHTWPAILKAIGMVKAKPDD